MSYDEIDKRVNVINDVRNEAVSKVINFATPKKISALFELIISIIMSVGINIIRVGFDFTCFQDWTFYVSTSSTTMGVVLIFRATINFLFDKTEKRPVVVNAKKNYKELNDRKDLDLKEFLNEFNLKTKTQYYVSMINKKIYKQEKKLLKIKPTKIEKRDKVEKVIDMLRVYISSDYITKHIDMIDIKYPIVFYSDFTELEKPFAVGIRTQTSYDKELNLETFNKIWWYVLSTALLSIGIFSQGFDNVVDFCTSLVLTLCMVVVRIATAMQKADKIYDAGITKSILDRTMILEEYEKWRTNNPNYQKAVEIARAEERAKAQEIINKVESQYNLIEQEKGA